MALRSHGLKPMDRAELSAAVRRRILKNPWSLIVAPRAAPAESTAQQRRA